MPKAFILINTRPDAEHEVVQMLRGTDGVVNADVVMGYYDIIAEVKVQAISDISKIITSVRSQGAGIEKTSTMIAEDDYVEAAQH